MIVKTFHFPEGDIHIDDKYIAKTPEEREQVERDIANAALKCWRAYIENNPPAETDGCVSKRHDK